MEFFEFEDVRRLRNKLGQPAPLVKGRVWPGEDKNPSWLVECSTFQEFADAVASMDEQIRLLAYDESVLDEETLGMISEDIYRFASEEGYPQDLIQKAQSALRSHFEELFAVQVFAFLNSSGPVLSARWQTELAPFIFRPERLLSAEGLQRVRKLKTLSEV